MYFTVEYSICQPQAGTYLRQTKLITVETGSFTPGFGKFTTVFCVQRTLGMLRHATL